MSIYQHMIRVVMAKLGNEEMSPLCLTVRYRDVARQKFDLVLEDFIKPRPFFDL